MYHNISLHLSDPKNVSPEFWGSLHKTVFMLLPIVPYHLLHKMANFVVSYINNT